MHPHIKSNTESSITVAVPPCYLTVWNTRSYHTLSLHLSPSVVSLPASLPSLFSSPPLPFRSSLPADEPLKILRNIASQADKRLVYDRSQPQLLLRYCTVLYCPVLHYTILYCPVLHCIALSCPALPCPALHCAVLCCTELCCAVLCLLYCLYGTEHILS